MKKFFSVLLASALLLCVLASCSGVEKSVSPARYIRVTSSDAKDAAEWLGDRLGSLSERIVLGTSADGYGVDLSSLEDDGYIIRRLEGEVALFARTANGLTYITKGTNAFLSAKITKEVELGSHTLFIAEITDMDVLSQVPSATYSYYQSNIKPKPQAVGETKTGQTIWRCTICGYEYVGEELPDDFICPICKHPKADFEKIVK